jgi:LuxR family quorum-sensing transcriptional regulator LasR
MKTMELFADLATDESLEAWRDQVFQFGANLGYQHASLAIFPSHDTPIETGNAFLHSTLPEEFLQKYDEEKFGEIDPVAAHCMLKCTPIIWSSSTFITRRQRELYEEAYSQGARLGIALPHHGPNGEFGMLCFSSNARPNEEFRLEAMRHTPELACFRDFIVEIYSGHMRKTPAIAKGSIEITARELECMKWCASGKSSWDIAQLMNCTEATVNYHFTNIRRKFGASSRRMAIIKAIRMGFITV